MKWPKRVPILKASDFNCTFPFTLAMSRFPFECRERVRTALRLQPVGSESPRHNCERWNRAMRSLGYTEPDGYMDI